jgi:putative iron-dependent peroxidase
MSIIERVQPGILKPVPIVARSLTFRIDDPAGAGESLREFAARYSCDCGVVGLGEPCTRAMSARIPGFGTFPAMSGPALAVPSTQDALWIRLCGPDRGVVFDSARTVRHLLAGAFRLSDTLDTFIYHGGRDLTRFEDGTENPEDDAAIDAAIVRDGPLAGSSFVAVQQWVHDLGRFECRSAKERDEIIGRSAETNEESSRMRRHQHT